jgi:hypothetical protein
MRRIAAGTLLLLYLVVAVIINPANLASGKLTQCSQIFAEEVCMKMSACALKIIISRIRIKHDPPVIACRSPSHHSGNKVYRIGDGCSGNGIFFCSCGGEFKDK